jgi:hypothetical protein
MSVPRPDAEGESPSVVHPVEGADRVELHHEIPEHVDPDPGPGAADPISAPATSRRLPTSLSKAGQPPSAPADAQSSASKDATP